jgi:hypothetical protein
LKMDLTEGSETSANIKQTLGKHPKVNTVNTEHSESLKSRTYFRFPENLSSHYNLGGTRANASTHAHKHTEGHFDS